ncbi:hypothetical protein [Arthrobacter psychrochitiniphilus]|uniref:Uncharacterized protein n=1 Tax=Arthrobacter psychrochitiniphilus TaxID=291045 RepID=A0A2V3DMK8_9MICC|nr:hypothetical protein [Arthrobacter psychrochitiniphilus]NYG16058.1 hypothetical protein [Arthrobacter psychrochitiniphilus]PXA63997.1 hypothetical protein CVS29_17230 [Arthrobacter psychrochitiniphilus]
METFWGLSGVAWTAIYSILTLGLLAVAVVASLYAKAQWNVARQQREDARTAQIEASRPYVIVTIEASEASQVLFDLVVKNIGVRPALNVTISLDPAPQRANESSGHEIAKIKMLNEPVSMIAPGQEMRTFYDSRIERNGVDGLPSEHKVSLSYFDSSQRKYTDVSTLDIEALQGIMYASTKTLHDIGKSLDEIQKTLKSASLLQRRGAVKVEASIETREMRLQREEEEQREQDERHHRIMEQFGFGDQKPSPTEVDASAALHEDATDQAASDNAQAEPDDCAENFGGDLPHRV